MHSTYENPTYPLRSRRREHLIIPEYVRLPASGEIEPYTGLNRSALERLILPSALNDYEPPVQSKLFNPAGGRRWIRLIYFRSLLAHLAKLPSGYKAQKEMAKRPKITTPRRRREKEPA
jgi:hypothetical protein